MIAGSGTNSLRRGCARERESQLILWAGPVRESQRDGVAYSRPRYVFNAWAGATLYGRTIIEEIGGFGEDFFFSWEDIDLSFRAQLAGFRCLYVPGAVVHHRVAASTRDPFFCAFFGHRNVEYFKNMPA